MSVYDSETGRVTAELPWKTSLVSLAISPDGRWVVAGTQENSVQIWPLPFREGEELAMSGYDAKVRSLAWHHSGRYLATDGGQELMVWDCSGKGPAGSTPRILEGHPARVSSLAYQKTGHLLASGCQGAGVVLECGQIFPAAAGHRLGRCCDGPRMVAGRYPGGRRLPGRSPRTHFGPEGLAELTGTGCCR